MKSKFRKGDFIPDETMNHLRDNTSLKERRKVAAMFDNVSDASFDMMLRQERKITSDDSSSDYIKAFKTLKKIADSNFSIKKRNAELA